MQQTFEPIFETNKDAEIGDFGDLTLDQLTRLVTIRNVSRPWIVVHLLQTKCDSATIGIDGQNAALELLALFQNFVRVTDLASPRHIGDVQQTIDALFEFDERTVVG